MAVIPALARSRHQSQPSVNLRGAANVTLVRTDSMAVAGTGENTQVGTASVNRSFGSEAEVEDASMRTGNASADSSARTRVGVQGNLIGCGCEESNPEPTCGCNGPSKPPRSGNSGLQVAAGVNVVAASTVSTADAYTGGNVQAQTASVNGSGCSEAEVEGGSMTTGNAGASSQSSTVIGAQMNGLM